MGLDVAKHAATGISLLEVTFEDMKHRIVADVMPALIEDAKRKHSQPGGNSEGVVKSSWSERPAAIGNHGQQLQGGSSSGVRKAPPSPGPICCTGPDRNKVDDRSQVVPPFH